MNTSKSLSAVSVLVMVLLLIACGGGGGSAQSVQPIDSDGDGVEDATDIDDDNDGLIEIATLEQLDWIRNDLKGETLTDHIGNRMVLGCLNIVCEGYELVADLDFDTNGDGTMDANDSYFDYDQDGGNNGWLPIGNEDNPFAATFEGNSHQISNLYIDRFADIETFGGYIGLFGYVDGELSPIEIRNVTLDGSLMSVKGDIFVGGLVGWVWNNVIISNSSATGEISGGFTGGLVGRASNNIAIHGCDAAGSVSEDRYSAGGLVGAADVGITIRDSSASGSVTSGGDYPVGGLIGWVSDDVTISNSSASGNVEGQGAAGGLLGAVNNDASISSSAASGAVSGFGRAGGLAGVVYNNVSISESSASGAVTGDHWFTGGLVGSASENTNISNSFSTGDVTGTNYTGGLVGVVYQSGVFESNYSTGEVQGSDFSGGLIGGVNSLFPDVYIADSDSLIIRQSFSTSSVTTNGGSYVGGLIGISYSMTVEDSFATGGISGADQYAGGLIGNANANSVIDRSFVVNTVDGVQDLGAFAGYSNAVVYRDNFFADDQGLLNALGTNNSDVTLNPIGTTGSALDTMQAVTSAGDGGFFSNWISIWDFGDANQLPGLLIGGVVYRDGDANGELD